jgi:hypothetical protein
VGVLAFKPGGPACDRPPGRVRGGSASPTRRSPPVRTRKQLSRVRKPHPKPCSRCRANPVSTPGNAYCKPCRAAYQRAWRARRKDPDLVPEPGCRPELPRGRLRGTPTREEMLRYRLI